MGNFGYINPISKNKRFFTKNTNLHLTFIGLIILAILIIVGFKVTTARGEELKLDLIQNSEPCPRNSFVFPDPTQKEIEALTIRISRDPHNQYLSSQKLPVGTIVYVPDGIFSRGWAVNEDDVGGFSSIARIHLRDKTLHEMTMQCLERIILSTEREIRRF